MIQRKIQGVCPSAVSYRIDEEGLVHDVSFDRGCDGNQQALSRLSEGRPAAELVTLLEGIQCGRKATSCPDQFARTLKRDMGM